MASDFDKWFKANGDAAYAQIRIDQATAERNQIFAERKTLYPDTSLADPSFQQRIDAKSNEIADWVQKAQTAKATAAQFEPTPAEKRDRYCSDATKAQAMKLPVATQNALVRKCTDAGGTVGVAAANPNANGNPAAPAASSSSTLRDLAVVALLTAPAWGTVLFTHLRRR